VLSHLKHPNIIELLSAYTYRGKHNLIFPLARGGNLASFLQNEQPPEFRPNLTLFLALAKLSSAIEQVHNLTAEGLDLAMIGCHHDLKPKNILVDGSSFFLADFGLSRFKSASETSDTSHKTVQGDYIAPECEELEGDFKRLRVNRSSDIWSFGCIISEVLTYMVQGPAGVTNFRKQRGFKLGQFRYYLFHHGPGQPSTGVAQWLSDLGSATHGAERLLLSLAKKMLSMDHTARPNAKETRQYMRLITVTEASRLVENLFGSLLAVTNSSEAFIESKRFGSWKWACGIPGAEEQALSNTTSDAFDNEFQSVLDTLFLMQGELETVINYDPTRIGWLYAPLRHLNTRLMDLIPSTLRRRMHTHFECSMTEAQDPRALEQHRLALDRGEIYRETGMLAAIKRMTLLTENPSELGEDNLRIEPKEFKQQEHFTTDCHVGRMEAADSDKTRQVLVEYLGYETSHLDEQIGKKRIESVVAIAKKLNSPEESAGFRSLRCSNYFHDEDNDRFGFVFDFPSSVSSVGAWTLGVTSLQRILDNTKHWRQMPALEDRYHLAEALAEALLKFHMAGWVHRRIASANIVFFQESDPITNLERPYIIGFSHSRLAEPLGFTAGPSDDKRYQHPTYLRDRAHFRQEFDYYSLGIVLLEIGLWKSLHQLDRNAGSTPEQFLEGLLQDKVPRLKATMGTKYFNVVDICLRGNFHVGGQPGGRPEDKTAMHVRFDGLVIQQLAKCTV
jgi:serine/threonine protein kinase